MAGDQKVSIIPLNNIEHVSQIIIDTKEYKKA